MPPSRCAELLLRVLEPRAAAHRCCCGLPEYHCCAAALRPMETPVTDAALDESEQRCDAVVWAAAGCAAAACAATAWRCSWARSLPAWLLLSLEVELMCSANDALEMPAMTPDTLRTLCCLRGWLEDDTMRGRCCYLRPPPSLGATTTALRDRSSCPILAEHPTAVAAAATYISV